MRWVRGLEQRQRQRQRSGSGAQGVASLRILVWLQPACRCWPRPASSAKLEHNCSTTCRSNACTGCNAAGATLRDCMRCAPAARRRGEEGQEEQGGGCQLAAEACHGDSFQVCRAQCGPLATSGRGCRSGLYFVG